MFDEVLFLKVKAALEGTVNLDYGKPRRGHPEATIRAHIQALEGNLERMDLDKSEEDYWILKILIWVHDSFKEQAKRGVAIVDPGSHASLAREFLAQFTDCNDVLKMVQYHDEPFGIYRKFQFKGRYNEERAQRLIDTIDDWSLFIRFQIIDTCTAGKSREPLHWMFKEMVQSGYAWMESLIHEESS